jgi:hypothetical protein
MAMRHSPRIVALAGVLTALGAASDASAQPAQVEQSAQVGSALVATSATPFQQYLFKAPCASGTVCTLDFIAVPPASRLSITNTSCYIQTDVSTNDVEIEFLQLLVNDKKNNIITASTLVPIFISEFQHIFVFSANHLVSVFANAGQHFQAIVGLTIAAPAKFFACHISGQLQKLG